MLRSQPATPLLLVHAAVRVSLVLCSIAPAAPAQTAVQAQRHVVTNVRLAFATDAALHTIVIRHGRIENILPAGAALPAAATVTDARGRVAVPAFIDAWTRTGCETPKPSVDQDAPLDVRGDVQIDMRLANRKGIQPRVRAADVLAVAPPAAEAWRKSGFGAALVAPGDELLAGSSVLATTRNAPRRDVIVRADVFTHAAFRASGAGYPASLMGYFPQLRQFFSDARHHAELQRRFARGLQGPRPPFDPELEAAVPLFTRARPIACEAASHQDIERWIRLADEVGFDPLIVDGRDAWRVAALLAARDIPVVLSLAWGDEVADPTAPAKPARKPDAKADPKPDEKAAQNADEQAKPVAPAPPSDLWEYEAPLGVRIEERRRFEQRRDNAIRLHEAGVRIAFGSGSDQPAELLKRVRTLVEVGLPLPVAHAALTSGAAALLGVDDRLGAVAAGRDATFAVWTDDPLRKGAELAWIFVDGVAHEFEVKESAAKDAAGEDAAGDPGTRADVAGTWHITYRAPGADADSAATLRLAPAADGSVAGTVTTNDPVSGAPHETAVTGTIAGDRLALAATLSFGDFELAFALAAAIAGDSLSGTLTFSGRFGERATAVRGERQPQEAR